MCPIKRDYFTWCFTKVQLFTATLYYADSIE